MLILNFNPGLFSHPIEAGAATGECRLTPVALAITGISGSSEQRAVQPLTPSRYARVAVGAYRSTGS